MRAVSIRRRPLAEKELKLDGSDAVADLVLMVDRAKAGDKAGALARAEALPDDGLHRYVGPLARAWTRMAMGNLAGADAALQELDKFDGFAPLKYFQLGLLYDFAGNADKGRGLLQKDARCDRPAELAADRRDGQFLSASRAGRSGRGDLSALRQGEFGQRAGRIGAGGKPGADAAAAADPIRR